MEHGVDIQDPDAIARRVHEPVLESGTDPRDPAIHVDGRDVGVEIRGEEVTGAVSPVAAVPAVRARLLALGARSWAPVNRGRGTRHRLGGRSRGAGEGLSSADAAARAARRALEEGGADVAATQESLLSRDEIDSSRATAPLTMADGRVHCSTFLTLDEVIAQIVALTGESGP